MLVRLTANYAVHAAAGLAVAGLATVAYEGCRRAARAEGWSGCGCRPSGADRPHDAGEAGPAGKEPSRS